MSDATATVAPHLEHLVRAVPDEHEVRRLLAQTLREADFLRTLLRIAKKKTEVTRFVRPSGKEADRAVN